MTDQSSQHQPRRDRFTDVLQQMQEMHQRKAADYGSADDMYGNFRPTERFGVPAWIGALIRQSDKVARIQSFITKGNLLNESVEDSLLDNAVYAVISYCLYLDTRDAAKSHHPSNGIEKAPWSASNAGPAH